jgi:hypothetical protein
MRSSCEILQRRHTADLAPTWVARTQFNCQAQPRLSCPVAPTEGEHAAPPVDEQLFFNDELSVKTQRARGGF